MIWWLMEDKFWTWVHCRVYRSRTYNDIHVKTCSESMLLQLKHKFKLERKLEVESAPHTLYIFLHFLKFIFKLLNEYITYIVVQKSSQDTEQLHPHSHSLRLSHIPSWFSITVVFFLFHQVMQMEYTVYSLLRLVSFTQHVLEIHPSCPLYWVFARSYCWGLLHCAEAP